MAKPIIEKLYNAGDITPVFTALSQNFYSFFLDSALSSKKLGRFSFLGCDPFLVFKSKGDSITLESKAGKKESFKANPFSTLKEIFEKYSCESSNSKLPFLCGGVGYFSYDLKNFIEELSDKAVDDLKIPTVLWVFMTSLLFTIICRARLISQAPACRSPELNLSAGAVTA
jgi:para-aminobenzoate synthetase component 1